jgi:ankyrin repeat protein
VTQATAATQLPSSDVANTMAAAMGDTLARSRSRSSDHNERLEPQLLRAVESDDVGLVERIVETVSQGAKPDGAAGNRLSPLLRAVENNHIAIVQLLLAQGADLETRGKRGRTALMYSVSICGPHEPSQALTNVPL